MIQRRNRPGFAFKPIRELLRRDFDSDIAPKLRVARFPYLAHAAFADWRDDLIRAEFVAGFQFHGERGNASIHYT